MNPLLAVAAWLGMIVLTVGVAVGGTLLSDAFQRRQDAYWRGPTRKGGRP